MFGYEAGSGGNATVGEASARAPARGVFARRQATVAQFIQSVRDARYSSGIHCPHCESRSVIRWGRFLGRQRYKCSACARTFNDLTGSPAAYSKRLELWQAYGACMIIGLSIRRSAKRVGIHPSTAFRWRHRICSALRSNDDTSLGGWVELGYYGIPFSEKGRRQLGRPARRRGPRFRNLPIGPSRVSVLAACDRRGGVWTDMCHSPVPNAAAWQGALESQLAPSVAFTAKPGRFSACAVFARRVAASYEPARLGGRRRSPLAHVHGVSRYVRDLRSWMLRFRGVATRYLPNYLAWHRRLWPCRPRGRCPPTILANRA